MERNETDILTNAIQAEINEIHTAIPGKIESYDPATKKANVKPLIKKWFADGSFMPLPVIVDVPVIFPGSSDFVLSFPLKAGDGVLIIFSERSMEYWLSNAMTDSEPGDPRKYDLNDAVCIPGLFSFGQPGKVGNGTDVEILYKNASIKIDDSGNVKINGEARNFVTHAELNTALQSFMTGLNLHIHSGVTTGPGVSGPPGTPMSLDITAAKTNTVKTG